MKLSVLTLVATGLMTLSISALASEEGVSSLSFGGGGDNGGGTVIVPPSTGNGCYYAYWIRKRVLREDDHHPSVTDNERRDARFLIEVRNMGNCPLRDVEITDFLPRGTRFESSNLPPRFVHDGVVHWDADIGVGRDIDIELTLDVNSCFDDSFTNTACAWSDRVGTRICDSATWFRRHDNDDHGHPAPPVPVN